MCILLQEYIIPPPYWSPRPSKKSRTYHDVDKYMIEGPIKEQVEMIAKGVFIKNNVEFKTQMSVKQFRKTISSKKFRKPNNINLCNIESVFWDNLINNETLYGSDTPGSFFDKDVKEFNINNLGTILDILMEKKNRANIFEGVNTPYLYFGAFKSIFTWHIEDMDLYSINYLHFGEPKFWYAIPTKFSDSFEKMASTFFPEESKNCNAFLRHKKFIFSPEVLKANNIQYETVIQNPGEFIISKNVVHCYCKEMDRCGAERKRRRKSKNLSEGTSVEINIV
uniref:JmjC domain-containing protein n=1 Tax=Meloidogyne floridensis TaxID=298350 RepID=A0A915P1U9_9BILA